ncbi:MAG: PrsW family intramembrane metalloprotease [Planctomycetes bacterium]|nr:PrsW family intramembrane metalloprotease [Planctomycetota bacterium]
MATWSVPLQSGPQGWKLRVLSGTSLGKEFDLPLSRYVLGSQPPANIVIPDPSIAPQHVIIEIRADHVLLTDCSRGKGMLVNDQRMASAQVAPGDHVTVGMFKFEFSNPSYVSKSPLSKPGSALDKFSKLPLWGRVGGVTFVVAAALFTLMATTGNPHLVPVTLIAMSVVVPATMICWLVERYDTTGISFHTLSITFLAGGTVGIIAAMINFLIGDLISPRIGGQPLLLLPFLAGFYEEPAKFLGSSWRWRHPRYDRPMDGLILGTVSGLGFAVFETAGYGFASLIREGFGGTLITLIIRSITSPFAHGLWTGILTAAFWQYGRNFRLASRSRGFWIAVAWAIGLHALWNAPGCGGIGYGILFLSAGLSIWQYRKLLLARGYRP